MNPPSSRRVIGLSRQEWALVAITVVWGGTFLAVHTAMQHTGPWFFLGLRFFAAGLVSVAIFWKSLRGITWREIGAGVLIGAAIYGGYGLQHAGLKTIDSSTSAFITAFYVPLVPLLQWLVLRKPPRALTLLGAGLAFVGLLLVAGLGSRSFSLGQGELLTLIATVPIAGEIILISLFAGRFDVGRLTVVQLFTPALLGFLTMPFVGESVPSFDWIWLIAGVALGVASGVIQLTMNWAQRSVSATRATIIYTGEPVWAGVVGRIAGERIPPLAILGAALIIAGTLLSELQPRRRDGRTAEDPDPQDLAEADPHPGGRLGSRA
ncbi:DMT family transporter [Microbacterium capsulatum]|uniref:DMT family transporter n=1 Tax=Microbacterium capsulatum TaxID=3041921 RepID=A0ABU0XJ63_9MICO|nr:DMT family transporter [Microbacterium sp. ASV81]MDQ4214882.1 DMT family transporter [Microbacterium sp. ASV81]